MLATMILTIFAVAQNPKITVIKAGKLIDTEKALFQRIS